MSCSSWLASEPVLLIGVELGAVCLPGVCLICLGVNVLPRHRFCVGLRRAGNPNFVLGRDSLGRRSWRSRKSKPVDSRGLREGLFEKAAGGGEEFDVVPVSDLGVQAYPASLAHSTDFIRETEHRIAQESSLFPDIGAKSIFAAWLGGSGLLLGGTMAGLAVGLPLVALAGLPFAVDSVLASYAKRKARRGFQTLTPVRRKDLIKEGNERVLRYGHFNGDGLGCESVESFRSWSGDAYDVRARVTREGLGSVEWDQRRDGGEGDVQGVCFFYPGGNLKYANFKFPIKLPGVNLRGADFTSSSFRSGSDFSGADFSGVLAEYSSWSGSFKGASLRGAILRGSRMKFCDFTDVDLSGADVTNAQLPSDLTRTNITAEQFDSLDFNSGGDMGVPYAVREVTLGDLVGKFGDSVDEVAVSMWAGDIEMRSRATGKVVFETFDSDKHFIPYWVAE